MRSRAVVSHCVLQRKKATMMMPLAKVPTTLVRQFTDAIRMNSHTGKIVASRRSPVSVGRGFEMLYRVLLPEVMSFYVLFFAEKLFLFSSCNSASL